MDTLTVGYVSGAIAAAVAVAQFIVPNALGLLLVAVLSDRHSAVTWSVASRLLSNTNWPVFLRSDQAASHNVARRVSIITWAKPLVLLCIAVAAVVTPMGLYETIVVSDDFATSTFAYVQDRGPLGLGTAPRTGLGMSRSCGAGILKVCPGSVGSMTVVTDENWINGTSEGWDFRLPSDLAELYQSGLKLQGSTVSSFFDIESRLFNVGFNEDQDNSTYLVDSFRPLSSFILTDKIQAVEGLVVDSQNPRVGFRNHTAPIHAQFGAEWEEDLLFFEPETQCVDTNISLEVDKLGVRDFPREKFFLVDKGGYADMLIENPWAAKMGMENIWFEGTQEDPQLAWRAMASGWSMNVLMAYFFNVTKPGERTAYMNSKVGDRFPVNSSYTGNTLNQVSLFSAYDALASQSIPYGINWFNGSVDVGNSTTSYSNPHNVSTANFTYLAESCQGVGNAIRGTANMTNILVKCGVVLGTAQPMGGEKTLVPQPNTKWTQPIYTCASTTKATIKTVRFRYNSTNHDPEPMNRFEVVSIVDKHYSGQDDMPLWGVEEANMSIIDVDPLWGIIDPAEAAHVNLSTVRADHLYLPAGMTSTGGFSASDGSDYMPAVSGPAKAWTRVYDSGMSSTGGVDYSGAGSLGVYNKWDNLTRTAAGTAEMLNFIWMDFAANGLVGSRGHLTQSLLPPNLQSRSIEHQKRDDGDQPGSVPVHLYHRAIRYRWPYGIPAFVTALLVAVIIAITLVALLIGRASPRRVQHYLWNLSAGRIFTSFLYPGSNQTYPETKEWVRNVGASDVTLTGGWARGGSPVVGSERGAGIGFAAGSTEYQKVSQQEPKEGANHAINEVRPVYPGTPSPAAYDYGKPANSDYIVPR